jgi:hypothetical protein
MGRTCLNLSKASKNHPSVNGAVDFDRSDQIYPEPNLPLLPQVAELACKQRDANPQTPLSGAIVDVSSAYHQFPQSVQQSKLMATQVKIEDPIKGFITLIIIYLVGIFGFTRAGNVFCVFSKAVSDMHNLNRENARSLTYIDDGILISPSNEIHSSVQEYIGFIVALFGEGGVNAEKVKIWQNSLIAIGWHFDFETWTVQPKPKGLSKLLHYLFVVFPVGATTIHKNDLEKLSGLLLWYASGVPAGRAFVASLFACQGRAGASSSRIRLSALALRDIEWWRALILVVKRHPHLMGASIDSVRESVTPTRFLRTDASSLVGGGGGLSITKDGPPLDLDRIAIRWTVAEIATFTSLGISINVLEFFVAIFYVMLWADNLRGNVVQIECDNTSAVAWLMSARSRGNLASDSLTKIFALFCLHERIRIYAIHIRGVDNSMADFRSRDMSLCPQEADEGIVVGDLSESCSRLAVCRSLLYYCLTQPGATHGHHLLGLLTRLHLVPG